MYYYNAKDKQKEDVFFTEDQWCSQLLKSDRDVRLATSDDLLNDLCMGGDPITGKILELHDGVYVWDYCNVDECYCYIPVDS